MFTPSCSSSQPSSGRLAACTACGEGEWRGRAGRIGTPAARQRLARCQETRPARQAATPHPRHAHSAARALCCATPRHTAAHLVRQQRAVLGGPLVDAGARAHQALHLLQPQPAQRLVQRGARGAQPRLRQQQLQQRAVPPVQRQLHQAPAALARRLGVPALRCGVRRVAGCGGESISGATQAQGGGGRGKRRI